MVPARVSRPRPVAVTRVGPLRCPLTVVGVALRVGLGAHQRLDERRQHRPQQIGAGVGELSGQDLFRVDKGSIGHRVHSQKLTVRGLFQDHAVTIVDSATTHQQRSRRCGRTPPCRTQPRRLVAGLTRVVDHVAALEPAHARARMYTDFQTSPVITQSLRHQPTVNLPHNSALYNRRAWAPTGLEPLDTLTHAAAYAAARADDRQAAKSGSSVSNMVVGARNSTDPPARLTPHWSF